MARRIQTCFERLARQKRSALIPFIMGCDPDAQTTQAILEALPQAGADLIEIGMPFSDPMADGPVIQAAGLRALEAGGSARRVLEIVAEFRKTDRDTPVILMGYYNPIHRFGAAHFCHQAQAAGVDGLIVVDLPPEEEGEIRGAIDACELDLIRLIAPTSGDERLPLLTASASGFVYYISIAGITGAASADARHLKAQAAHIRKFTALPVAVGFGIKTPEQAAEAAAFADAVVVGSALVDRIAQADGKEAAVRAARDFVHALALAIKSASGPRL